MSGQEQRPQETFQADRQVQPDMTRAQQTKWIVGTIIVIAAGVAVWALQPDPNDMDSKCVHFLGLYKDQQCLAENAAWRMRNSYSPY